MPGTPGCPPSFLETNSPPIAALTLSILRSGTASSFFLRE